MLLFISLCFILGCAASAEKYLLTTLYTVTKACHPEFTAVTFVNERQITRFDSLTNKLTSTHSWVRETLSDHYWDFFKQTHLSEYARLREELNATIKSLGHISDFHTLQRRSGCEWNEKTNRAKGFDEYGYDGEDFISLDLNQMKYIPHTPLANITAERWNCNETLLQSQRRYYNTECGNWLKRFGKANLELTGNISFYQKRAFSPVVCRVSGFCPSALKISWHKKGKETHENVSIGAVLPDGDGTYMSKISVFTDDFSQFACVVGNTTKDLSTDFISENTSYVPLNVHLATYIGGLIIIVLIVVISICYYKKKQTSKRLSKIQTANYQSPKKKT